MAPELPHRPDLELQFNPSSNNSIENFIIAESKGKLQQFTHAEIKQFTSEFKSHVLGSGRFGVVYKGRISDHVAVAVKVLNDRVMDGIKKEDFIKEVIFTGKTNHRNLIKLYGFCFDEDMKALVYEYMEKGSLDKILYNHLSVEWVKLHHIALETAKGVDYLHEGCIEQIYHRDIKASNVLLDSNLFPKLADFGFAKIWNRDLSLATRTRYVGTPGYDAPEVLRSSGQLITYKCDVYDFGLMLFEVMSRKKNNKTADWFPGQVWEEYAKGQLEKLLVGFGIEKKDIEKAKTLSIVALWCVQYRSIDRPPMRIVVKMLEGVIQPPPPPNPSQPYVTSRVGSTAHTTPYWSYEWVSSDIYLDSIERAKVSLASNERDTLNAGGPVKQQQQQKKKKKKKMHFSLKRPIRILAW